MNYKILLLALVTTSVVGCSAYKAGQTPDDVYYSPAKEAVAKKSQDRLDDYLVTNEDQYLRMKVRNRSRWSTIDDFDYWYDTRYSHCVCDYSYYNQYGWNNWHISYNRPLWMNPWMTNPYVYNGWWQPGYGYYGYTSPVNTKYAPRASNVNRPSLNSYRNNQGYNNTNFSEAFRKIVTPGAGTYSNSNSGSNSGTRYSSSTPSRTYNPSSSSGSSSSGSRSSGSSSSGGGVSRPARGGN